MKTQTDKQPNNNLTITKINKMDNLDEIMIRDAVLVLENESAFYQHFLNPYSKNLKRKIKKETYNTEKAVNGLQEQIRVYFKSCTDMRICKYRYKYIPTVYKLTKAERVEVARGLIENFEMDNIII